MSTAFRPYLCEAARADRGELFRVGQLLSRYKSGPLPKAFKILPTLPMWPQLIMLTNPETWTPHATYAATRIFASNLDPKQSQKYYKEILLEKVREEIGETGKLSVHTYMALKKAMYKPAAFFKGLLFPLCEVRAHFRIPQPMPYSADLFTPRHTEWHLHLARGCYSRLRLDQGVSAGSAFRCRPPQAGRDGIHW